MSLRYLTELSPSDWQQLCRVADSVYVMQTTSGQQVDVELWKIIADQFIPNFNSFDSNEIARKSTAAGRSPVEMVLERLIPLAVPIRHLYILFEAHQKQHLFQMLEKYVEQDQLHVQQVQRRLRKQQQQQQQQQQQKEEKGLVKNKDHLARFQMSKANDNRPSSFQFNHEQLRNLPGFVEAIKTVQLFQFQLIFEATNGFSPDSRLSSSFSGAFGDLFLVYRTDLGGQVVVKRFSVADLQNLTRDRKGRAFEKTVRTMQQLQHKNIVSLIGISIDGQNKLFTASNESTSPSYFCTIIRYYQNGSLKSYLNSNDVRHFWRIRQKILYGICDALDYCHSKNIVHGDVKPSNVLIDDSYEPLLADFDTATDKGRIYDDDSTNVIGFTNAFLPPEATGAGSAGKLTKSADVWALGLTIAVVFSHCEVGQSLLERIRSILSQLGGVDAASRQLIGSLEFFDRCLLAVACCLKEEPMERATANEIARRIRSENFSQGFSFELLKENSLIDRRLL